ncbi:MAG: sigma 54-interacting transcriptional regulator, partial [Nitrospirales bacterium]
LQVKLLRAIQEREILSIGSTTPTKVDARIIAATNKDLKQAVREGQFREDLYYRINVVTMQIPPLRDRRDDIPSLAQHFLQQAGRRIHKDIRGFHPEALQKLMLYPWPGNVRELENVVEKAVILSPEDHIPAHLIPSVEGPQQAVVQPLSQARAEFERRYLQEILEYTGGNISRAAEIAGRYRADFYKLLKKHGLHSGSAKAGAGSVRTTEPGKQN